MIAIAEGSTFTAHGDHDGFRSTKPINTSRFVN
jgi:hypothetical protein